MLALTVPCPTCHAPAGAPCVWNTPTWGEPGSVESTHTSRVERGAANEAGASARRLTVACVADGNPVATYLCGYFMGAYHSLPHEPLDSRQSAATLGGEVFIVPTR